jgi:hypothetical protein
VEVARRASRPDLRLAHVGDERRRVPAATCLGRRVDRSAALVFPEPVLAVVDRSFQPPPAHRGVGDVVGHRLGHEVLVPASEQLQVGARREPWCAPRIAPPADLSELVDALPRRRARRTAGGRGPRLRERGCLGHGADHPGRAAPDLRISPAIAGIAPSSSGAATTRLCGGIRSAAPTTRPAPRTVQRWNVG